MTRSILDYVSTATTITSPLATTLTLLLLQHCVAFTALSSASAQPAMANKLAALEWAPSNRLFKSMPHRSHLTLSAHIGDSIDLLCPNRSSSSSSSSSATGTEYSSILYKVSSKSEFDACRIDANNEDTRPILKCERSASGSGGPLKFTVYFVKYSPVPNALEFEEGREYYFVSTSSGARDGMRDTAGGLCAKHNMRFSIRIASTSERDSQQQQQQEQHDSPLKHILFPSSSSSPAVASSKYHHKSHHEQIMAAAVVDADSSETSEPLVRLEANADAQLAASDRFQLHRSSSERLSALSDANAASRSMSIAHLASHFCLLLLCVLFSSLLNL